MDDKTMANVDRAKLIDWLSGSGGYDILAPNFFLEMGFPLEFVKRYTVNHQGGEGKHAITSYDGQENAAFGVSEFEIVPGIARALGLESTSMFMGRGKNYRVVAGRILTELKR